MFSFFLNNVLFFPPSICRCPICHTNNLTVSILYLEIFLFLLTGVSMLLNHQTNPLVAQLRRCHKVVCMRRKVKKVLQLLQFKFAWKDIIWTDRLSTAKILEPTISKFESHWFGCNTTLVLICDSNRFVRGLAFEVPDPFTKILCIVRFRRYVFDHWLRAFFIGLSAAQIFKGWRMWKGICTIRIMMWVVTLVISDMRGPLVTYSHCSFIKWENALLVKFLILLPYNQL